jgi:hypothetical protein
MLAVILTYRVVFVLPLPVRFGVFTLLLMWRKWPCQTSTMMKTKTKLRHR